MKTHRIARFLILLFTSLLPITSWAQTASGTIAGLVRDTSGAVMPGVTGLKWNGGETITSVSRAAPNIHDRRRMLLLRSRP